MRAMRTRRRAALKTLIVGLLAGALAGGLVVTVAETAAAAPTPLPSTEASSPALESLAAGRLEVFTKSGDDALQQSLFPGAIWRRPLNRGGTIQSQPVVVSWGPGRLDVFARGTDNTLWHRASNSGTWSAWESLGGVLTSAPAAASWQSGRLDVFVRSTGDTLYHKTFASGAWSNWKLVSGLLTSSPAVTSWGPGRLDIVVRSSANAFYHKSYSSGIGWSGWTGLAGSLTSQPAVASPASGYLDVVGRGTTGAMYLKRLLPGSGWTAWTSLGAAPFTSGPGMTSIGDDIVIAARRSNGFLYQSRRSSPTAAWSSWQIIDQYLPFRRLATWVDVFDYPALDPATSVADMQARGVRTLFLATGRFDTAPPEADFFDEAEMAAWLDAAHAAGIRVVGWYVPAYGDMARDVRRTVAIGNYVSPTGQRFDAVGVDIERFGPSGEVDRATFNARVVPHLQQVRAGTSAVIGAIVPSPFTTDPGNNWEGFPWSGIGPNSEVVVPMALWSFRSNFSAAQVEAWVTDQIDRTQALTGRRVHVEGGVIGEGSTPVTAERVQAFVDATIAAGAIGGSQYDYNTMNQPSEPDELWPILTGLNSL